MGASWDYYIGCDIGQANDPTAIAIVEEPTFLDTDKAYELNVPISGWVAPDQLNIYQAARMREHPSLSPARPVLSVRHLERLPLQTKYPAVVAHLVKLMNTAQLKGRAVLIVDATGVGRPIVDALEQAGLLPVAITITGGNTVGGAGRVLSVPKRDLVGAALVCMQAGRLKVSEALPEAQTLVRELLNFKVTISTAGHDSYAAWRESVHDDLVLALSIAVWFREYNCTHLDNAMVQQPHRGDNASKQAG